MASRVEIPTVEPDERRVRLERYDLVANLTLAFLVLVSPVLLVLEPAVGVERIATWFAALYLNMNDFLGRPVASALMALTVIAVCGVMWRVRCANNLAFGYLLLAACLLILMNLTTVLTSGPAQRVFFQTIMTIALTVQAFEEMARGRRQRRILVARAGDA